MAKILPCFVKPLIQKKKSCPFTLRSMLLPLYCSMNWYSRSKSRQCPALSGLISLPRAPKFKHATSGVLMSWCNQCLCRTRAIDCVVLASCFQESSLLCIRIRSPPGSDPGHMDPEVGDPCCQPRWSPVHPGPTFYSVLSCVFCNQHLNLHLAWLRQVVLLSSCSHGPGWDNTQK